ncbi:hypothetical protein [Halorarius halobius]|uniref:hypothetical protein n=1 Tax=Halorarius halobius TaxID=2962671 RepID=UPI0020CB7F19|nr:hypothetical protein [Halorarius halobius]
MSVPSALRYAYREIRDNYDDRFWWRNRFFHRVVAPFHLDVYPTREGSVDVMAEDWDTLVVLDACRRDLFEERADVSEYDDYRTVTSRGSATQEWVLQNFTGESYGDTVYVTANPFVSREAGDAFHALYEPWLTAFDEETRTVLPEETTRAAIEAHREHPDKRLVVHYMQPHHPFVTAPDLRFHGWQIDDFDDWTDKQEEAGLKDATSRGRPHTPWDALYMGLVERDDVWAAYGENLDVTLESVDDLLAAVDGRTVVTSDHGNMLGERTFPVPLRVYGHPSGVRNRELVEVPWAVIEGDERREVTDEGTNAADDHREDVVQDRLEDLGYV